MCKEMEKISVIIPTKDYDELLLTAIRSALAQTYPPFEVIICDVNNTSERERIQKIIGDPRLRWVYGGSEGLASIPRNRGIEQSRGDWLAFLDSDDEWSLNKLEKQLIYTDKGVSAVCTNAKRFIPNVGTTNSYIKEIATDQIIYFKDLIQVNDVICSSVLVKKELVIALGGFPEDPLLVVGEDYVLWLKISTQKPFQFINEDLVTYRDDPTVSIRAKGKPFWTQRRYILLSFFNWLSSHSLENRGYYRRITLINIIYAYCGPLKKNILNRIRKEK
jgi:glycosyltransferase involved in cell wall biosynthesis